MQKILIVEDEKVLREAFVILLEAQKTYDIDSAANGQEALECCKETTYDAILLDLMMPVLDGVGFLEQAQLEKTAPSTKVIILSNLSSGNELEQAIKLGAHRNEVKSNLSPGDIIKLLQEEIGAPEPMH